jgi:predicted nucleic acid-binding protein
MTDAWVVDASVVAKWVLPEPASDVALKLRGHRLVAPEFLDIECASIVWKTMRRDEITAEEALELQAELRDAPVERLPNAALLPLAMLVATEAQHSVYDCLYVAAAELSGLPLITADRRLARLRWRDVRIVPLDDLP